MNTRNESDTAWKEILDTYFKDFIDYCLPELSKLIDWSRPWTFLDKELQAITKGTKVGKQLLDKLVKVFLKNGQEQWILVHIEIQGTPENDFPKRIFTYHYRIFDKYQQPVVSCVVLTDKNKNWRPDHYKVGLAGSYLSSEFLVIKLIDYRNKQAELETSTNIFANVILAQLAALDIQRKPAEERKHVKFALTKRLYEKGFNKKEISNLYKFIDWLIGLPKPLELEYMNKVYELEEDKKMTYITSAERLGIEKGRKEGVQKGIQKGMQKGMQKGIQKGIQKGRKEIIEKVAKHLLEDGAKLTYVKKVTGLSLPKIKALQKKLKQH